MLVCHHASELFISQDKAKPQPNGKQVQCDLLDDQLLQNIFSCCIAQRYDAFGNLLNLECYCCHFKRERENRCSLFH